MPKTRTLLAIVLIPLLAFLVACGGGDDDDSDSSNGNGQPAATAPSGGSDSGSSGSSGSGSSGSSSQPDDSDDDEPSDEEILANCPELMGVYNAFASGGLFGAGSAGNADFDLEAAASAWQEAADNAPGEIQADMQVFADAISGFVSILAELDVDLSNPATFATLSEEDLSKLEAASESFGAAEVEQAANNLEAYFTEKCS
jgi:hypothetical protein